MEQQVAMLDQLCRSWTTCGASCLPPSSNSSSPRPGQRGPRGLCRGGGGMPCRWGRSAAPWLVLVENSLGAMVKLQIWFGFAELMMMAWGGRLGQDDSSNAQQMRMQSSLGLLHMAAAGGNEQAGAVRGETQGYLPWSLLLMPGRGGSEFGPEH